MRLANGIKQSCALYLFCYLWQRISSPLCGVALKCSKSLVAIAGIDPPPDQSGQHDSKSRSISKRGSPLLRKTLFQIIQVILQKQPVNEPVYQFLDRKRAEGKPYRVYMIAAANKFLRIYFARVMEALG